MKYSGISRLVCTIVLSIILWTSTQASAQTIESIEIINDVNGWKLQVDGDDYYIKGVVWGYSPRGESYKYNLWAEPDQFIKKVLDYEFPLMREAGINTIRTFSLIPPKWVAYIYHEYGIRTVINPLFGRYGQKVNGLWRAETNYAEPVTRQAIKKDTLEIVESYRNTPGILMFALGNENNYGLEWTSYEIENLPVGERQKEKAKYLYSLFNEVIKGAKQIDGNHPFAIVNGDIQYLNLIRTYCTELDVLGINAYRGVSFTELWKKVKADHGLPIVLMELGSDAYNAIQNREDQQSQAWMLKGQWQEMYDKSYGNGEEGNSLGGFVFEWRDEWWKYKQEENLDIHDRVASWSNGAFQFDYQKGENNVNEEWFGINRLGEVDENGVYTAEPRMAYDVLTEIWKLDPYKDSKQSYNQFINSIDMDYYSVKSDVRYLKSDARKNKRFKFSGGSLLGEFVATGNKADIDKEDDALDGVNSTHGEMVFLDFEFQPTSEISGQFTLNVLGNVADKKIEFSYGRRGLPTTAKSDDDLSGVIDLKDRERVEIYDFEAKYENSDYRLTAFHHVPRYHWGYEGDFFGLLREATDLDGMDIWNAKAPSGFEYAGKNATPGLTMLLGPELYWGANPKAMLKYDYALAGADFTFIHSHDIDRADASATASEPTQEKTSQTTLYMKKVLFVDHVIELGVISSGSEKTGEKYDYYENGDIYVDEINFKDTLGFKAKYSFDLFNLARAYGAFNYAGLVADAGEVIKENGTQLPYSEYGNKQEVEGGMLLDFGKFSVYPRFLYRNNIVNANPLIEPAINGTTLYPGIDPRNRDDDPFAVLSNRKARSAEVIFTWDPTPATPFYAFDNDRREDAFLAFNLGFNYTQLGATDSYLFYYTEGQKNAEFGEGLQKEDVWNFSNRVVLNPKHGLKLITKLEAGFQQSTGQPGETREYYKLGAKLISNKKHIHEGYVKVDAFGPYDFYRQFNKTYPLQLMYNYSLLLDSITDEKKSSKVGFKLFFRTLDENSPADEYRDGKNDSMFEISTYFKVNY